MKRKRLPQSLRKYVRLQKALIRRNTSDLEEQQKAIGKLYEQIGTNHAHKRHL